MANCLCAHEMDILMFISYHNYQNNTRVSAWTVRHESAYSMSYLTRHNESINDDKNDNLHTSSPCLTRARFKFCWWRHNRLLMASQWAENSDASTWQVITNSLDIDFIHSDIHGRSCKKEWFSFKKLHFKIPSAKWRAFCSGTIT